MSSRIRLAARPLRLFCGLCIVLILTAFPAWGQEPDQAGMSSKSVTHRRIINRAGEIMAREVVNEKGVHLGFSKDLVIGRNACITYLVMLRGSAFGIIGPLVPVPWSMVKLQEADKPLLLNVEYEVIRDAPGFPLDNWPDFLSPGEAEKIENYFRKHLKK